MPKISALPTIVDTDITTADFLCVVDSTGPTTSKVTVDNFRKGLFLGTGMTATPLAGVSTLATSGIAAVGSAVDTTIALVVTGALATTGTTQYGIKLDTTAASTATTAVRQFYVQAKTAAAAFTSTNVYGVYVDDGSAGAGSTITNLYGIYVVRQTAGGTLNYGVRIAGGATRGLLIDADGATITAGGLTVTDGGVSHTSQAGGTNNLGVGAAAVTSTGILVNTAITIGTSQYGIRAINTHSSSATTAGYGVEATPAVANAAFTMTNLYGFYVGVMSKGGSATVTNVYGLYVSTQTIGGTINYGIYVAGGSPAIYVAAGGLQVQAGNIGVGIAPSVSYGIRLYGSGVTSATAYGVGVEFTVQSSTTTAWYGYYLGSTTAAAAFTITDFYGIYIAAAAKGAGSTITNRYGLYIVNPTDGGTLNRALYVSGAAAVVENQGRYMAMSGTAVPATAGAVAAGAPITMYSGAIVIEVTSDTPTHTRAKGSICINTGGSSTSTRMYVNTDGAGTWASFTTSA